MDKHGRACMHARCYHNHHGHHTHRNPARLGVVGLVMLLRRNDIRSSACTVPIETRGQFTRPRSLASVINAITLSQCTRANHRLRDVAWSQQTVCRAIPKTSLYASRSERAGAVCRGLQRLIFFPPSFYFPPRLGLLKTRGHPKSLLAPTPLRIPP